MNGEEMTDLIPKKIRSVQFSKECLAKVTKEEELTQFLDLHRKVTIGSKKNLNPFIQPSISSTQTLTR
jgi:hypothetical protein